MIKRIIGLTLCLLGVFLIFRSYISIGWEAVISAIIGGAAILVGTGKLGEDKWEK